MGVLPMRRGAAPKPTDAAGFAPGTLVHETDAACKRRLARPGASGVVDPDPIVGTIKCVVEGTAYVTIAGGGIRRLALADLDAVRE